MDDALSNIPFYSAYIQRRAQNEQAGQREDAANLQQATGAMSLLSHLAQQRQQAQIQPLQVEHLRQQIDTGRIAAAESARQSAIKQKWDEFIQSPEGRDLIGKGDLKSVVQKSVQFGFTNPIEALKEADAARYKAVGANGLFDTTQSTIVATPPRKPTIEHNFSVGDNMVQPHISLDEGKTWMPIPGSQPSAKFAKQVAPVINQEAPVTPVTIADPNDQNKTIIIDGRTGKKLGNGPKATELGKLENTRAFGMQGLGGTIAEAERILTGGTGNLPTGSTIGNIVDTAAGVFGVSPSGAREADQLKALGGALTSKMPRMQGPQSDKDVLLYKEMAGRVGDPTLPRERRIAALDIVKQLWAKYETSPSPMNAGASGGWGIRQIQ
jgi:hypothetical protein